MQNKKLPIYLIALLFMWSIIWSNNFVLAQSVTLKSKPTTVFRASSYTGKAYRIVNDGNPDFTDKQKKNTVAFEKYSKLDKYGRCRTAFANICPEIEPTKRRKSISSVYPSGWKSGMGWQRCHLIGFQLSGENANRRNLITGTQYMNISGMLPFENMVDDYVDDTDNHVLYRVKPHYKGHNLIAEGVQIEAYSVEDFGKGICFNVFCYNVQPHEKINYKTGLVSGTVAQSITGGIYSKTFTEDTIRTSNKTFKINAKAKNHLTYIKVSGSNNISINSKGLVTIAKGIAYGTYKATVKIIANSTLKYKAKTIYKTILITIKQAKIKHSTSKSSSTKHSPSKTASHKTLSIVYWTPSGTKYHSTKDCPTLSRSSTICSGSIGDSNRTACKVCC